MKRTIPVRLALLARSRSGDKGASANIGVIARGAAAYDLLARELTAQRVAGYFSRLGVRSVIRYEMPRIHALNFVLQDALADDGVSLRIDAQGKTLGQAILEMIIEAPEDLLAAVAAS